MTSCLPALAPVPAFVTFVCSPELPVSSAPPLHERLNAHASARATRIVVVLFFVMACIGGCFLREGGLGGANHDAPLRWKRYHLLQERLILPFRGQCKREILLEMDVCLGAPARLHR